MKKIIIIANAFMILLGLSTVEIQADSYNYNPLGEVIFSAEAMQVENVIDSSNILDVNNQEVDVEFGELTDVFGYQDKVYLVEKDTGLVHVLNSNFRHLRTFGQEEGSKLDSPQGIFVTDDGIYIADTNNYRIAIFNHDYELVGEITAPDDPTFKQDSSDTTGYDFKPLKVAVHSTGRVYVIADQIFEGILDFNPDGTFSRYVGASTITLSVWDAFWLRFTSEEQRKTQGYRLATTFKNVNIDDMGYLYTVSSISEGEKVVKKLNYKGLDVLNRGGYIPQFGDSLTVSNTENVPDEPSEFIDIDMNEYGNYVVLDKTRGRIFTYDFEGDLLYVFGELGTLTSDNSNQRDLFLNPTAVTYYNDKVLVVDSMNKNLVVFGLTEFGELVNKATYQYYNGNYETAKDTWEDVLKLNTNYFLAYSGIAKAELRSGDYEKAMEYAKLGYDDYTYSSAFQTYRYNQLVDILPYIIGVSIVALVYAFIKNMLNALKKAKEDE